MPTATKTRKGSTKKSGVTATTARRAADLFKQGSDTTRLLILLSLSEESKCVMDLCTAVNQEQPAVSHHLALMRHGKMVEVQRKGKNNFYSLTEQGASLVKSVSPIL